jgi:hypothetical protein
MWTRVDDIDGTEAQQVTFGLDGRAYTLDLGQIEHQKLRGVLKRFIDVAREYGELPQPPQEDEAPAVKVRATRGAAAASSARSSARGPVATVTHLPSRTNDGRRVRKAKDGGTPHALIRQWAGNNGYEVQPRGRIPANVIAAYESAR